MHTGGHPLHTASLLAELPRETLLEPSEPLPAPRSLAAAVRRKAAALSPDARALVAAQAILARPGPLSTTATLGGVDDPAAALEEASTEGFLSWSSAPTTTIAFRHPLLRAAIYGALPPSRRRALHAEAASLVEHRAAWRHRVAAAEGPDPALAAELESTASAEAARGGFAAAATYLLWSAALSGNRADREARLLTAAVRMTADGDGERALVLLPAIEACAESPMRSLVLSQLASLRGDSASLRARPHVGETVVTAGLAQLSGLYLTGREGQVARLVARGLTNREAAAELHVTPKTIDFHLGRIYAKLGLESRRQLRDLIYPPESHQETRNFA
jgi:DNA-binding CsgD family transcriptional regulator